MASDDEKPDLCQRVVHLPCSLGQRARLARQHRANVDDRNDSGHCWSPLIWAVNVKAAAGHRQAG